MKKVTTQQLEAWRDRAERFHLINVLPRDSFEQKHIPGSVNVPFGTPDFVKRVSNQVEGDKNAKIVVHCSSTTCDASQQAARQLEQAGFMNVHRYEEGIEGWSMTGHEVEAGAM